MPRSFPPVRTTGAVRTAITRVGGAPVRTGVTRGNTPLRKLFAYNVFTGSSQGGSGTAGSSTRAINDATRTAKTSAIFAIPGVSGISHVSLWEKFEPLAPVGGVHTYDPTIFDLALAENDLYAGAQVMFRLNGGDNDTPNYLGGGGTDRLSVAVTPGQTHIFLPGRTAGTLPVVGQNLLLTGGPDQRETILVDGVTLGTGDVLLHTATTGNHDINSICDWGKVPTAFQGNHDYLAGDLIIAPPGGLNTMGVPADGFVYSVTQPYHSAATFWPIEPTLCELAYFPDGSSMPVPWDPNLLQHRKLLIAFLGKRYNGDARIFAIQCAGGGRVGEVGIDGSGNNAQQRVATWLARGYNDWALIDVWKQILDAYAAAFPNTRKIMDTGEPWGQNMVWPTGVALANCTTNATSSVSCTSSAGAVVGMLVYGHADVQNMFVGTVPDGTHITLSSSPSANVPINANGSHAGLALMLNSTSRSIAFTLSTNDEQTTVVTVTDGSLTLADRGKQITGSSFSGRRYVGPIGGTAQGTALGLAVGQFLPSTSRIAYVQPASHAIAATTLTLAFDGLNYSTLDAVGGIVTQAISGKNTGGSLVDDVYTGGTPIGGYLAAAYPGQFYVQQNGLATTDYLALALGRFRQLFAGIGGVENVTLKMAGAGYQPVGGGNDAADVARMFKVASDDNVAYMEPYANDLLLAASNPSLASAIWSFVFARKPW